MSFHLEQRTLYTVLCDYIAHYGPLTHHDEQLSIALKNTEQLIDFSLYKADVVIDVDAANRISRVGLAWLEYAKTHPEQPDNYAQTAKATLERTARL